jgi:hypothetical protein
MSEARDICSLYLYKSEEFALTNAAFNIASIVNPNKSSLSLPLKNVRDVIKADCLQEIYDIIDHATDFITTSLSVLEVMQISCKAAHPAINKIHTALYVAALLRVHYSKIMSRYYYTSLCTASLHSHSHTSFLPFRFIFAFSHLLFYI